LRSERITTIITSLPAAASHSGTPLRSSSRLSRYTRKSLAKPLDVKRFAKRAAMSERTFQRRFRESVGLSPADWLQRERMYRARELLEATDDALYAIAEQCGYRSLETFRAAFRRVVGASPSAYRARFRRDE
jgi:AraC family transcriptional regulator, transcriptional activator FtrA